MYSNTYSNMYIIIAKIYISTMNAAGPATRPAHALDLISLFLFECKRHEHDSQGVKNHQ